MPARRRALLSLLATGGTAALIGCGLYLIRRNQAAAPASSSTNLAAMDEVCFFAPLYPWSGSGERFAARQVPAEARCPVCGMYPSRYPHWAAQVIFSDGDTHFLDSPLSLFHYLQRVHRFAPGRKRSGVAAIYVSNVNSEDAGADRAMNSDRWVPAEQAFFVHGSDLMGPMRSGNLPATSSMEAANLLIARHGGTILRFSQLEDALPSSLHGLVRHGH